MKYILGIETSCDDTSISVVDSNLKVHAIGTASQTSVHSLFGGVIPEIAARNHVAYIFPLLEKVLGECGMEPSQLDAVAVTNFPGLIGSLLIGVSAAKGLALGWKKPLIAVNHLEGHIYSAFLERDTKPEYPYLSLIVSGGHTSLMSVDEDCTTILGETFDDAAGEAFDKVAKMAGIGYPGGPVIDRLAQQGSTSRYKLPYLLKHPRYKENFQFSFSGIKSAVRRILEEEKEEIVMPDLMASFQERVVELIERRLRRAFTLNKYKALVVAGGVAANSGVRLMAENVAADNKVDLYIPQLKYCQDNGAMCAAAAFPKLERSEFADIGLGVRPTVRSGR